jgi:hypothetical protein
MVRIIHEYYKEIYIEIYECLRYITYNKINGSLVDMSDKTDGYIVKTVGGERSCEGWKESGLRSQGREKQRS